jgi:hypothetical protein
MPNNKQIIINEEELFALTNCIVDDGTVTMTCTDGTRVDVVAGDPATGKTGIRNGNLHDITVEFSRKK